MKKLRFIVFKIYALSFLLGAGACQVNPVRNIIGKRKFSNILFFSEFQDTCQLV